MLLRHIRYFLAVVEHRNFTRAAEALYVSQPTLSQQVRQLEDTLHVQLFDRSGRTIQLTDAGEAWLLYAQRAVYDLEAGRRAIHDVQDLSRGSLRLAMTPTFTAYLVGPLIEEFNQRYPGVTLNIKEMSQEQIELLLSKDELDVGIAFSDTHFPDLEAEVLLVEVLTFMVGKLHSRATMSDPLTLLDFGNENLVLLNQEFATRQHINHYCSQHNVAPRIVIEANSISAIIDIVSRSQLATILPAAIALQHDSLCPIKLDPLLPQRTAVLLRRKGAYRSFASQAFVDLAINNSVSS